MAVRLGKIELNAVQDVRADDNRSLVALRVPGATGGVFQDLGRAPASVVLEGLITGTGAEETLEKLRSAYQKAEPMSFASDIAIGTEMTDVVIADLLVRQEAGHKDRYRFTLRIREHVEPPESAGAGADAVGAAATADGAGWADNAVGAGAVLADPSTLADALGANPALLDQLSADQLGDALSANADFLDGNQLGDIVNTVGSLDPSKAGGMLEKLKSLGGLGSLVEKLAAAGQVLLKGFQLVKGLLGSMTDVLDLVKRVKELIARAKKVWEDVTNFKPFAALESDGPLAGATVKDLVHDVSALIAQVGEVLAADVLRRIKDIVKEVGVSEMWNKGVDGLSAALGVLVEKIDLLKVAANQILGLKSVLVLTEAMAEAIESIATLQESVDAQIEKALLYLRRGQRLIDTTPGPEDIDDLKASFQKVHQSLTQYKVTA